MRDDRSGDPSTAELAVEQVLAGFLGLTIVVLPFVPVKVAAQLLATPWAWAFLGAAYLVGALFDRVFDHVLDGVERVIRLQHGRTRDAEGGASDASDAVADPIDPEATDSAPPRTDGATEHVRHLRGRIRCTRMVAVAGPLAALAYAQRLLWPAAEGVAARLVPALLLLAAVLVAASTRVPGTRDWDPARRTSKATRGSPGRGMPYWRWVGGRPLLLIYAGATVSAAVVGATGRGDDLRWLPALGLALGLASTWAWVAMERASMRIPRRDATPSRVE